MSAEDKDNSWRTPSLQQNVVQKIEEAIRNSSLNPGKNSVELENHIFQRAKTKEDYLSNVHQLIMIVYKMGSGSQPVGSVPGVGGDALGPPGPGPAQAGTNALQSEAILRQFTELNINSDTKYLVERHFTEHPYQLMGLPERHCHFQVLREIALLKEYSVFAIDH